MVATIEKLLLEEVLHILEKAEEAFDVLEYSFVPSLQFVLPAFYELSYSGKVCRGIVWRIDSFRAFGKRKFGELIDQPIDH